MSRRSFPRVKLDELAAEGVHTREAVLRRMAAVVPPGQAARAYARRVDWQAARGHRRPRTPPDGWDAHAVELGSRLVASRTLAAAIRLGFVTVGDDGIVRLARPMPTCVVCGQTITAAPGDKRDGVRHRTACVGECARIRRSAQLLATRCEITFDEAMDRRRQSVAP